MSNLHRSQSGIYTSPWGNLPPLKPGTLYEYALGDLRRFKDEADADSRLGIADYVSGDRWTLQQVREETTILAANLVATYGIKKGDNVIVSSPAGALFTFLAFACVRAGAVPALANPGYTPYELKHVAQLVDAKLVLTIAPLQKNFEDAGMPKSRVLDASRNVPREKSIWHGKVTSYEDARKVLAESDRDNIDWNEPSGIFFSSGTTGLPKAVLISHRNLICESYMLQHTPGMTAPSQSIQRAVHYLPAFHVAGYGTVAVAMIFGEENHFVNKAPIDLPFIVKAIKELKPYRVLMVPPLLMAVVRLGLAGPDGLRGSVGHVLCAAAPLGAEQQKEAAAALGVPVGQLWGMSETTGASTATSPLEAKIGSEGRAMPGVELRIIDDAGKDVQHGDRGEILVRGPNVMLRYFGNEEATRETVDGDGWLHTGDVGYMDNEAHLHIVDRQKELIKYKAFQVAPAELEALLLTHPAVMDAGVTGVQDKDGEELPRAFVVLRPEYAVKETISSGSCSQARVAPSSSAIALEISGFVAERVANYKHLRGGVVLLKEIPKNPSGKILRRVLREISKQDGNKL